MTLLVSIISQLTIPRQVEYIHYMFPPTKGNNPRVPYSHNVKFKLKNLSDAQQFLYQFQMWRELENYNLKRQAMCYTPNIHWWNRDRINAVRREGTSGRHSSLVIVTFHSADVMKAPYPVGREYFLTSPQFFFLVGHPQAIVLFEAAKISGLLLQHDLI